jgi:hypothetical protein
MGMEMGMETETERLKMEGVEVGFFGRVLERDPALARRLERLPRPLLTRLCVLLSCLFLRAQYLLSMASM